MPGFHPPASPGPAMTNDSLSKDHRIMIVMRKVLSSIIKDTTPPPGMRHPLSDKTIDDVRQCLALISAREKELAEEAGFEGNDRPYYIDEPQQAKVIPLHTLTASLKKTPKKPSGDDPAE